MIQSELLNQLGVRHYFFEPDEKKDDLFFRVHQVHGKELALANSLKLPSDLENIQADGILSRSPSIIPIGVQTADCIPALFSNSSGEIVAAVHAGWKGVLNGILKETVSYFLTKLNEKPENLTVALGPSIRHCCFEVDQNTKELFENSHNALWMHKTSPIYMGNSPIRTNLNQAAPTGNNIWIDLKEIAKLQLNSVGVNKLDDIQICTYCNHRFASHRRATHKKDLHKKRQWSFIYNKI